MLDLCVEIPQYGIIRSLNVHVSGSILLWEYISFLIYDIDFLTNAHFRKYGKNGSKIIVALFVGTRNFDFFMEFQNSITPFSYSFVIATCLLSMSKIIQSAYSFIESQKYKKAATLLDSPEVARFPLAKVFTFN